MQFTVVSLFTVLFAVCGVVVVGLAGAGWTKNLPRNRFAGVRTPAAMRSEESFQLANKIAAPGMAAGGGVFLLTALGVATVSGPVGVITAGIFGGVCAVFLVGFGAYAGGKAAERVPVAAASVPVCPYSAQQCAGGGCSDSDAVCGS